MLVPDALDWRLYLVDEDRSCGSMTVRTTEAGMSLAWDGTVLPDWSEQAFAVLPRELASWPKPCRGKVPLFAWPRLTGPACARVRVTVSPREVVAAIDVHGG